MRFSVTLPLEIHSSTKTEGRRKWAQKRNLPHIPRMEHTTLWFVVVLLTENVLEFWKKKNLLNAEHNARMFACMFYYNSLIRPILSFTSVIHSEVVFILKMF